MQKGDPIPTYRTTADPERVARLESLLREIGGELVILPNEYVERQKTIGNILNRIAALLGPAE